MLKIPKGPCQPLRNKNHKILLHYAVMGLPRRTAVFALSSLRTLRLCVQLSSAFAQPRHSCFSTRRSLKLLPKLRKLPLQIGHVFFQMLDFCRELSHTFVFGMQRALLRASRTLSF